MNRENGSLAVAAAKVTAAAAKVTAAATAAFLLFPHVPWCPIHLQSVELCEIILSRRFDAWHRSLSPKIEQNLQLQGAKSRA